MAFSARARMVNPRLGTYFSIFAALFTALFLLILIFEQLSLDEHLLRLAFFVVPIIIYAAIGLSVASARHAQLFRSRSPRSGGLHGPSARRLFARRDLLRCRHRRLLLRRLRRPGSADRHAHGFRRDGHCSRALLPKIRRLHRAELPRPQVREPAASDYNGCRCGCADASGSVGRTADGRRRRGPARHGKPQYDREHARADCRHLDGGRGQAVVYVGWRRAIDRDVLGSPRRRNDGQRHHHELADPAACQRPHGARPWFATR